MAGPSTSAAPVSTAPMTTWWQRFVAALRRALFGTGPVQAPPPAKAPRLSNDEWEAQAKAVRSALSAWLERDGVPFWRLVTVDEEPDSESSLRSWFGGGALLEDALSWPVCPNCKKHMHHFLQLDLATLPLGAWPRAGETGLLSLFYCSTDDGTCEVWDPKSGATVFIYTNTKEPVQKSNPSEAPIKKKSIVSFKRDYDPPAGHPGVDWVEGVVSVDGVSVCSGIDEGVFFEVVSPTWGDKLGGAPLELQGPQPLYCPVCSREMRQLFQIDSNDNLEYAFGDSGCAHIVQCEDHPEQCAFWWDCC